MKMTAHEWMAARRSIEPAAHAIGTINGAGFDGAGYEEALIMLDVGALGIGATVDVKIQSSPDNVTFTDIPGAVFSQKTDGVDDLKLFVARINLSEAPARYLRAVGVVAVASADFAASMVLGSAKVLPVAQSSPVGFNI